MKKAVRKPAVILIATLLAVILVAVLLLIGRINWSGRDYAYNPKLPKPGIGPDFKYDDVFTDLYAPIMPMRR